MMTVSRSSLRTDGMYIGSVGSCQSCTLKFTQFRSRTLNVESVRTELWERYLRLRQLYEHNNTIGFLKNYGRKYSVEVVFYASKKGYTCNQTKNNKIPSTHNSVPRYFSDNSPKLTVKEWVSMAFRWGHSHLRTYLVIQPLGRRCESAKARVRSCEGDDEMRRCGKRKCEEHYR